MIVFKGKNKSLAGTQHTFDITELFQFIVTLENSSENVVFHVLADTAASLHLQSWVLCVQEVLPLHVQRTSFILKNITTVFVFNKMLGSA